MARPARPRVFLDTNVLFSALYSSTGPPAAILQLHIDGKIVIVVSRQVLEELIATVSAKLPRALPALQRLLTLAPPEVVADPPLAQVRRWRRVINPGDAPILAAAVVAQPLCLVTGDQSFVGDPEVARTSGLLIVTPSEFMENIYPVE